MPQKILIIRFSSIGDIVLTTPVMRCLKQQLPGCIIHYATKKQFASLLAANPHIDQIHTFEEKKLPTLIEALDKEKFDLIIDLHNNARSWLIRSNLGIEYRAFNKLNIRKSLLTSLKINLLPDVHIVDRYLQTIEHLGVVNDGKGLDHFIPEKDIVALESLPSSVHNGFIAFVIGATYATKRMPIEKAIEATNRMQLPVILIGGPEDAQAGDTIAQASSNTVLNACGKYNLQQSASIIQQSVRVYAHDTGMMHIAAALQKEVISIWGNTVPAFGMYPYYGTHPSLAEQRAQHRILEVEGLSCRPCHKLGHNSCPKGHFRCMNDLDLTGIR